MKRMGPSLTRAPNEETSEEGGNQKRVNCRSEEKHENNAVVNAYIHQNLAFTNSQLASAYGIGIYLGTRKEGLGKARKKVIREAVVKQRPVAKERIN